MWKPKITRFSVPTHAELASLELQVAKRDLLTAQTGLDYATAMVQYHQALISRLEAYLEKEKKNDDPNRRHPLSD